MNNTTTSLSLEYLYAFFVNSVVVVRFYQIGYPITFLLGFIGNAASLITFSRSTLRKVSTGCLFITLAISDTLFLCMCIFDFIEFGLQIPFYRRVPYDELCRFRSFVMYVSQILSAWILVTISIDRWIRTRFPFKSGSICTPKKALVAVGTFLIIDIGVHSHMLTSLFGMLIPGFANGACGPRLFDGSSSYFTFYLLYWSVVQILMKCLIPVVLMTLILIDIFINVRIRKRAVIHPNQVQRGGNGIHHQRNLQTQMFILMLTRVGIFSITTLPVAIFKIASPRENNFSLSVLQVTTIWTGLGWFQSLNFAVNFYMHCLTSKLFRKEFKEQMQSIWGKQQTRVNVIKLGTPPHRNQARL